jgi:DNA-binding NarL/FixJ family response regulator
MSRPIRVLIADDHAVMRSGLRLLLESQADLRVVDECGTHQEVLAALAGNPGGIDIISLDLSMPGGSAGVLIEDVVRRHPDVGVVVLTMHDDASHARRALAAGARGYVVKSAADRELLSAIRAVADGRTHVGQAVGGEAVVEPKRPAGGGSPLDTLSDREREVLVLVAQGHTNQQIADALHLSVKTIESYRSRLMAKLGLTNRAELTKFALDAGLMGGA